MEIEFKNFYNEVIFIRKIVFLVLKNCFKEILHKEFNNNIHFISNKCLNLEKEIFNLWNFKPNILKISKIKIDKEINTNILDNLCRNKNKIKIAKLNRIDNESVEYNKIIESKLEKPFYKIKNRPSQLIKNDNNRNEINMEEKLLRKVKNNAHKMNTKKLSIQIKKKNKNQKNSININKILKEPHTYNVDGSLIPVKYSSKKNLKKLFSQIKINMVYSKKKNKDIPKKHIYTFNNNKKNKKISLKTIEINNLNLKNSKLTEKTINLEKNNKISLNGIYIRKSNSINIKDNLINNNFSLIDFEHKKLKMENENINLRENVKKEINKIKLENIKNSIVPSNKKIIDLNKNENYNKKIDNCKFLNKKKKIDIKNKNIFNKIFN